MPMPSDALAVVLMPGLLHPTVKRPDARWRLSIDEVARVASDADAIRCTGGCLDARLLHPTVKQSDALAKLSDCQAAASDRETVRCALAVVCGESPLQSADCNVIRDEMPKVLHPMLRPSDALAIFELCLLPDYRAGKLLIRSKCRLVAFDRFISLTWLLGNLVGRNEFDSYGTF